LEQRLSALTAPTTDHETLMLAAISAALVAHDERTSGRVAPSAANAVAGTMANGAAITEGAFGWAAVARRE
ncbi:MAG: acetyl-CoA carboxylase biotin carboxylase subunit, partial [Gemmatimonas sp.]